MLGCKNHVRAWLSRSVFMRAGAAMLETSAPPSHGNSAVSRARRELCHIILVWWERGRAVAGDSVGSEASMAAAIFIFVHFVVCLVCRITAGVRFFCPPPPLLSLWQWQNRRKNNWIEKKRWFFSWVVCLSLGTFVLLAQQMAGWHFFSVPCWLDCGTGR